MATGNAINANSAGLVKYDGAGTFSGVTVTQYSPLVGAASNGITSATAGTNGQVFLGSTGTNPTFATLTGTGGITFTTGAGTLAINGTGGGLTWSVVTVNAGFTVNTGTVANKAGVLTMTLPASAAVGDIIAITNFNTAAGWLIAQNANQLIRIGSTVTTTGAGGSLAATALGDSVTMVCTVAGASTNWQVINSMGNITVV